MIDEVTTRRQSSRTTITHGERLQLIGLATVSQHHVRALRDLVAAAVAITGEIDDQGAPELGGHTSDAMWEDALAIDRLLFRLDLEVAPDA